jgi:predicted regulator of Ras-like GTPase activity (Roadblock/LC7/MglB family)
MTGRFAPLLESLTRLRGIRGAMVVDAADGLVVDESVMGGLKATAVAAMAANIASRAAELAGRSDFGLPRFLHLQAQEGSLLVAPAPRDLLLVAIAGRDVPLGLLRLEMLRMAERLT